MKVSVIYHSASGNTARVAQLVAAGAESAACEVRAMPIEEVDAAFVAGSGAVIFGCPVYAGSVSWQMKKFLDTTAIDLAGKVGGAFSTADYLGGGGELAQLAILGALLVRGMLAYSAGFAKGAPFTHFGAATIKAGDDAQSERAKLLGKRIAEKAVELF